MQPRHRFPRWALAGAAVLALATVAWIPVGVPTFVKYPTDLDVSPQYEGTFTLFVDADTAAPLDEPLVMPLSVDRRIRAVEEESGSSLVVVEETIVQRAGDLIDATQTNVYVMDRRSLENVADERAYAFVPSNVVDRSPAFRLNLPFGTDPGGSYEIYQNEIDDTYRMQPATEDARAEVEGLTLDYFEAAVDEAPMTPAYFEELNRMVPMPSELTFDQLRPHLLAAGIDVDAVLDALLPVLSPEDLDTLLAATEEPIGLQYVVSFQGRAGVETTTGAEVDVRAGEAVGARPDPASTEGLRTVLSNYPDVPEAVGALESLDALLSGPPVALFEYEYAQTPESIAAVADEVRPMRQQILLATVWLPIGLVAGAILLLAIGGVVWNRRRRQAGPTTGAPTDIDLRSPAAPDGADAPTGPHAVASGGTPTRT